MDHLDSLLVNTSLTQLDFDTPIEEDTRQKFLRFSLGSEDSGLLPLEQLAEVLNIALADILPIPEMPSCVLGISNWRGKMLWLIDLNHLIDYPLTQSQRQLEPLIVIVIQMNGQSLGLVVQHVNDIELHDKAHLQPAAVGLFPAGLLPFVKGYLPSANGIVLDTAAIARCPLWQVHRG